MLKQKIIVIGLDGATWTLLSPFVERGELPAFKKIMERGVYGTLMSSVPCRTGTAAVTFYTGKNHCKWGGLNFSSFDPDVVKYEQIKEKNPALWDILGKFGHRSAILNLPTTHPPTPLNGVMISGFSVSEEDDYSYPKDFKKEVKGFHSEREIFLELISGKKTAKDERELFDLYRKSAEERYCLIKNIIKDESFDFSIFWLDEFDSILHHFWGQEDYLLSFCRNTDNILKDITENNPDANIIIMSDHGFDARPIYEFYVKSWLKQEGYLKLKGSRFRQWLTQAINSLIIEVPIPYRYKYLGFLSYFYNKAKNLFRNKIKRGSKKINLENRNWRLNEDPVESRMMGLDLTKTIAINHDFWGIKLIKENLGRDYEEVRREIMEKMKQLQDKNGESIIKYVWRREEIFSGVNVQKYPDIVYLPASKFLPTGFLPFSITKTRVIPPGIRLSPGSHMTIREGIFVALGPNIKNAGEIGNIDILDMAPTILHLFGAPVPEDMDGRVLKEIIL